MTKSSSDGPRKRQARCLHEIVMFKFTYSSTESQGHAGKLRGAVAQNEGEQGPEPGGAGPEGRAATLGDLPFRVEKTLPVVRQPPAVGGRPLGHPRLPAGTRERGEERRPRRRSTVPQLRADVRRGPG